MNSHNDLGFKGHFDDLLPYIYTMYEEKKTLLSIGLRTLGFG